MKIFYTLLMAAMMLSFTGCSLDDLPFGPGNKQEENKGNENTGADIPEEPLTSGPASVAITRATATTAHFEGCITNDDIDLDFVQITVRYAEPENFSAMSDNIPSVVITRPDFENDKNFSFNIEDLHFNTLYKFCAIVQYKSEVFYSDVEEFKTAGVNIELAVKEDSITDSSVEFIGSVHGLSPEDEGKLEIGLIYGDNKSLVEGGEGEMVVIDAIAEDGTFNLSLTSLYDGGPTFYFRSYVEQNGDYILGEIDYFEFDVEPVRLVKKITRHEKIHGAEVYMIYEFEHNGRGNVISSKVTLTGEDEDFEEYLYTYDYSTNGVVSVNERTSYNGESYEEQTYKMNVDDRGYVSNYDYTWEDGGEIWYYTATFDYSEEGFLERWFVNGEDDEYFGINYSYLDGCLMDHSYIGDEVYNDTIDESFTSDQEVKRTSFDINKALIPWLYPEECSLIFGAVNIGTMGGYYFDRMTILESFHYEIWNEDRITDDANYKVTSNFKFVYCEEYEEDFCTLPVTTATYDKDGYPVEFIADVREYEGEMEITYAAGEIIYENEDGPVYEVVEVDRKIISKGPATSVGSATITIEYCE